MISLMPPCGGVIIFLKKYYAMVSVILSHGLLSAMPILDIVIPLLAKYYALFFKILFIFIG